MLILTLAMWTIAIILIMTDPHNKNNRWLSAAAFVSGLGGFSAVWEENLIPWLVGTFYISDYSAVLLDYGTSFFSALSHYFVPYTILMYGVVYSEIRPKAANPLAFSLLLPIIYTLYSYPSHSHFLASGQELTDYYKFLSLWAVPYLFVGNLLILYPYIIEKRKPFKKARFLNCLILIPFITFSMFTNYIFRYLGIHDSWRYNSIIIAIQFIGFIYFALKYGILGVRLKLEQDDLGNVLKIINSGTAMLNHTLKNEMLKISLCCNFIRKSYEKTNPKVEEKLIMIEDSIKHLLSMVERVQEHSKEIKIEEASWDLRELIEKALHMVEPLILEKGIKIYETSEYQVTLKCDETHIKEVLVNLFKNAIEAMDPEGHLTVEVNPNNQGLFITIKDNGPGIPKENFPYILEPFFTTKANSTNFGLGLAYCHSVMKHHGGTLDIESEEKVGTCIILSFPKKSLIKKGKGSIS